MGLISRVSSRTYREDIPLRTSIAQMESVNALLDFVSPNFVDTFHKYANISTEKVQYESLLYPRQENGGKSSPAGFAQSAMDDQENVDPNRGDDTTQIGPMKLKTMDVEVTMQRNNSSPTPLQKYYHLDHVIEKIDQFLQT